MEGLIRSILKFDRTTALRKQKTKNPFVSYSAVATSRYVLPCLVFCLQLTPDLHQALRNPSDLSSMDCPAKYRVLGDFHHYYSGRKEAEVITLVVGGNHESQSYLKEW